MKQIKTLRKRAAEIALKQGFDHTGRAQLKKSSINRCVEYGIWITLCELSGDPSAAMAKLAAEEREYVGTDEAARYLGVTSMTLHNWRRNNKRHLNSMVIMGRLLWPVSEIRRCVSEAASS